MQLTPLQRSTLDPGYEATRRYIHQGRRFLKPGGRLTLGFSSVIGRLELLQQIAAEAGLEARVVASQGALSEFSFPTELFDEVECCERVGCNRSRPLLYH